MIINKKLKKISKLFVVFALFNLGAVNVGALAQVVNFGDPNIANLTRAMASKSLHVVQLGDSHTAGDTMTESLRNRLQAVMGDGGMGFAMPMYFDGQRMARFGYDKAGFVPISSRNGSDNFTLGGMIAKPQFDGATLTLKAKGIEQPQRFWIRFRQSPNDRRFIVTDASGRQTALELAKKDNTWQFISLDARLPMTFYNDNATGSAIGGVWAFNPSGRGAIVSAIGINGSELSHWNRWNITAWQNELATIHPRLIILAYGTNEAHNGVSGNQVATILTQKIRQIRRASPTSAILILSAPESLKSLSGSCGVRPATLSDIQSAQRQVAQTERTLYWDWQGAMGGSCAMKSWIDGGLANRDGVHFTKLGYQRLGNDLANDLLALGGRSGQSQFQSQPQFQPVQSQPKYQQPSQPQPVSTPSSGGIKIEWVK